MGVSKLSQYSERELKMRLIGQAFAHPARIRIIDYLNVHGFMFLKDAIQLVDLAYATVTEHLEVLINAGMICESEYCNGQSRYEILKCENLEIFAVEARKWFLTSEIKPTTRKVIKNHERLNLKMNKYIAQMRI